MTPEQMRQQLEQAGLGAHADALMKRALQGIVLDPSRCDVDALGLGESRLGGLPDLPAHVEWPTDHKRRELSFVAQINLADLPRSKLPSAGSLAFFYEHDPGSGLPHTSCREGGEARVYYFDESATLERKRPGKRKHKVLPACSVEFRQAMMLPDHWSIAMEEISLTDLEQDALIDLKDAEYESHLLGHPNQVQSTDPIWYQMRENPLFPEEEDYKVRNAYVRQQQDRERWRLLLDLSSCDETGMMWGDLGAVHYYIREADLLAERFNDCWAYGECS